MNSITKLYSANEQWKNEVMGHFDLVAENIRHDLTGANRDELESLKNTTKSHERRIKALELRPV